MKIFNWIVGLISILIIAAFFWPQKKITVPEKFIEVNANPQSQSAKANSVSKSSTIKINRDSSFTKADDDSRVESFREAERFDQEIRALLNNAQALFDQKKYTLPEGRNAIAVYQEVLNLSPNNSAAKKGISNVSEQLLIIGKNALNRNKLTKANQTLQKLIKIDQESPETILLTSDISIWHETKKRLDLLSKADQAFESNDYIAPATKNALYFYEQVLTLEPNNLRAKNGIQNIINIYLSRVQDALAASRFSEASTNVEILNEIDPNYPLIPGLKNDIRDAQNNQNGGL